MKSFEGEKKTTDTKFAKDLVKLCPPCRLRARQQEEAAPCAARPTAGTPGSPPPLRGCQEALSKPLQTSGVGEV